MNEVLKNAANAAAVGAGSVLGLFTGIYLVHKVGALVNRATAPATPTPTVD